MNPETIGQIWRDQGSGELQRVRVEALSAVRSRAYVVIRRAWRAGIIDRFAAPILVAFFAYSAVVAPTDLAAVGAGIITLMGIVIPFRLRPIRTGEPDPTVPVARAIRDEITRLRVLERYQRTLGWYLGPLALGAVLYEAGLTTDLLGNAVSVGHRARMSVLVAGVLGLLVYLNRRSLRFKVRPLREELESWVADIGEVELNESTPPPGSIAPPDGTRAPPGNEA